MLIPQKHYVWECDYGDREPVFQALASMLKTAAAYEMPMVALFANNSPYCFEFYVAFGFETASEAQIGLMHRLMVQAGSRMRSDIPVDVLLMEMGKKRFNSATVIDEDTLSTIRDSKILFFTPEKKVVAKVWPVTPIGKGIPIFLSHSSRDKSYVESFMAYMVGEGVRVWYDKVNIDYGDNITEMIQKGIGASGGVVFFVTESFLDSRWCKREMNTFLRKNIDDEKIWIGIVRSASVTHDRLPEFLRDLKYFTSEYTSDPQSAAVEISACIKRKFQVK